MRSSKELTVPMTPKSKVQERNELKNKGNISNIVKCNSNIPFGEAVAQFAKDARSHHVPENAAKTLTEPKTPQLLTKKRARSVEERQMTSSALNISAPNTNKRKIFRAKDFSKGVPKLEPRPLTEPTPFKLATEARARLHSHSNHMDTNSGATDKYTFKALPMPNYTELSTKGVSKSMQPIPLTVPKSPKLSGLDQVNGEFFFVKNKF
jgi:hypothetical protein